MKIKESEIKGIYEIKLTPLKDNRGFFMRTYDGKIMKEKGLDKKWVQENHSFSKDKDIVRGLHYQLNPHAEAKLVRVTTGEVFVVFVDLRKNSLTFGKCGSIILSDENKKMLYFSRGFAMGICTLTDNCTLLYKMDNYYVLKSQGEIKWNDPELNIQWPTNSPILSERDSNAMSFKEFKKKYGGF